MLAHAAGVNVLDTYSSPDHRPQKGARQLRVVVAKLWVTLSTIVGIGVVGMATRSAMGETLHSRVLERFGFAPSDWLSAGAGRSVSSALFTSSAGAFWFAVLAIAVLMGSIEWRWGHLAALLGFWGSHVITLVASAVPMAMIGWFDARLAQLLLTVRDVGP